MPLHAGTRLGAYEIVAPLGAGGMGEVYRARDASLGREVAIKILPESFVDDPERVARFEREAQLLAALNHPHIAAIYGLERLADTPFLVLELVDGETLADRLEGPTGKGLGLEESLSIARQIADALQAAHEKGIVHRDLKPANIALTRDGAVKVLDFGLARQDPASGGSGGLTHSPTLTVAHTQAGVILGTAAYMSPEQAKGRIADKRSDVWSFGCVLYEMLTGTRAFEGEDISETLAAILRAEPDWTRLPEDIPSPIRALVERCRMLAFTMRDDAGKVLIWLRPIDALAARPLIGTDAAEFPFWSPDGRGLGYFAHDKLMRIDAAGGPPQTICAAGGEPVVLTKAEVGNHRFPSFLPDGRHVLLAASTIGTPDKTGLYVTALDSPQPKRLAAADSSAVYASPGFLLFARQATLLAQPFNLKTLDLTGEPTPIAERVESGVFDAMLAFSVSDSGTLAYGLGTGRTRARSSCGSIDKEECSNQRSAIRQRCRRRALTGRNAGRRPSSRSRDRRRPLAHRPRARHDVTLHVRRGAGQFVPRLVSRRQPHRVRLAARRSMGALCEAVERHRSRRAAHPGKSSVWMLPLAGDRKPVPVINSRFHERFAEISPDGKWLAYTSDENGMSEVYIRPFPKGDGKWQISTAGGWDPRWRGDSKELFFENRVQLSSMMAVDVNSAGSALSFKSPRRLFDMTTLGRPHPGAGDAPRYAVSHDGQRFLIRTNPRATTFADSSSSSIAVVVNWAAALQK